MEGLAFFAAAVGDELVVSTKEAGELVLRKQQATDRCNDGWRLVGEPEGEIQQKLHKELGARMVSLSLYEPNRYGSPLMLRRVVMRQGDILGLTPEKRPSGPYEYARQLGGVVSYAISPQEVLNIKRAAIASAA